MSQLVFRIKNITPQDKPESVNQRNNLVLIDSSGKKKKEKTSKKFPNDKNKNVQINTY